MADKADGKGADSVVQLEDRFSSLMARDPMPAAELKEAVMSVKAAGRDDLAESWAEVLQDELAQKKQLEDALEILYLRALWASLAGKSGGQWAQEALDICGTVWDQKALVDESGFGKPGVPPEEAVRRLQLLRALGEGVLCYDKTWGLGVVLKLDSYYKKIEIDFERRQGHQLAFAYAAEKLQLVGDNHILVWKRKRAGELAAMVEEKPAEVARLALRSFGPLTTAQFQTVLSPAIVPEPAWKKFWERVRKAFKNDSSVIMPSGRTEPIRLLEGTATREDEWYAVLARELNLDNLLDAMEELAGRAEPPAERRRAVIKDRLAYAIHGTKRDEPGLRARFLMAAEGLGMLDELGGEAAVRAFHRPDELMLALRQLPAKMAQTFLAFAAKPDQSALQDQLLRMMTEMEIGVLNEAAAYLLANGQETAVSKVFIGAMASRKPGVVLLNWLARNSDYWEAWQAGSATNTVQFMLTAMEEEASGQKLKAQNQLRERFAKPDFLKEWMERLTPFEVEALVVRIKDSSAWPALDRKSIMAQMVKLRPELAPLLASKVPTKESAGRSAVTSERSYRERQAQLDHIINVEIPKVAKDIGIARSYGDLRENFEYKAAKEAQSILFHRRDELMKQLRAVTPVNFRDFVADRAGIATTVRLQYPDGREEQYYILGEWDGDTTRSIISSTSRMAQALFGHGAGDDLVVPSENGETQCRLTAVGPLPEEILAWSLT